jgi:hypothetical protein
MGVGSQFGMGYMPPVATPRHSTYSAFSGFQSPPMGMMQHHPSSYSIASMGPLGGGVNYPGHVASPEEQHRASLANRGYFSP